MNPVNGRSSVIAGNGERNMKRPRWLNEFTNTVLVQLFKHLPGLAERWARATSSSKGKGFRGPPSASPFEKAALPR